MCIEVISPADKKTLNGCETQSGVGCSIRLCITRHILRQTLPLPHQQQKLAAIPLDSLGLAYPCVFGLMITVRFIVQVVDATSAEKMATSLVNAPVRKTVTGNAKGVHPGLEVGAKRIFIANFPRLESRNFVVNCLKKHETGKVSTVIRTWTTRQAPTLSPQFIWYIVSLSEFCRTRAAGPLIQCAVTFRSPLRASSTPRGRGTHIRDIADRDQL